MTNKDLLPAPKTTGEALQFAETLSKSAMIPTAFRNKPQDIFVAMLWSHSLQIPIVQGLQSIAVINGKPSLYGDGLLAVVMASGQVEDFHEEFKGEEGKPNFTAVCTVKRAGIASLYTSVFSVADAISAGLWSKPGPWKQYPKRMLKMRARAFALRDAFPDVLSGMSSAEEQYDIDGDAVPKDQEPPKKMPKRKAKPAAEDIEPVAPTVIENNPTPTAEPTPTEPDNAATEAAETTAKVAEFTERLKAFHNREELVNFWKTEVTEADQQVAELVQAFRDRMAAINRGE